MSSTWDLEFITEDDFHRHVKNTVAAYQSGLKSYDLELFNKNTIDPIKLLLDKSIYQQDWQSVIASEIFRQRDKGNNNTIGYFHQNIFRYIDRCEVPYKGWDVIYRNSDGIDIGDGLTVSTVYVEMKNKHNTMNSASEAKTYNTAQQQLLDDDEGAVFLVEAIARQSQNVAWNAKIDGRQKSHKLIRRVSIDQFYKIVTGDDRAFWKVCQALPPMIDRVIGEMHTSPVPTDTVYDELEALGKSLNGSFTDALYQLGFSSYLGFS